MLVGERGNSAEREKEESDEHHRSKTLTASLLIVVLDAQGVNFTQQDWKTNLDPNVSNDCKYSFDVH